jgi:hypothetical protein
MSARTMKATVGAAVKRIAQLIKCMPVNRSIISWRSLHLRDRVRGIGG